MYSRRLKTGYLVVEGINSFVTVYYFYYLYFYMQHEFGFGNKANLALAALNGGTYALCAWLGGRFAQRRGYFTALKTGFWIMLAALAIGSQLRSAPGHIVVMVLEVWGMSFTWPTLEALVSEDESPAGLQHMVGIYNVVWAGTAAVSNFLGGAMFEHFGSQSLFYVPIGLLVVELGLTMWLQRTAARVPHGPLAAPGPPLAVAAIPEPHRPSPARAKTFQRLGWLANPFAYIALNTLIAVVPGVAVRLGLSTTAAGFCCSVWSFARLGSFFTLWLWSAWHYRFRWLLAAYVAMIGTFATIVLAPNVGILVGAQIVFGGAIGLMYYSSLFYSMDASDTKGEHGGIHEAAIGFGNLAGPAAGALALQWLPHYSHAGAIAVSLLLLGGLGGLALVWRSGRRPEA